MKRLIVDYKKLTEDILSMLVTRYPNGYTSKDIITFKNAQSETIEAIEVRTEDTIYLVKVSTRLADTMQDYEETMEEEDSNDEYTFDVEDDFDVDDSDY